MSTLLTNVEFSVHIHDDTLTVTAPFWRTDIEIPEDVVEEIGRLYGYDKLPLDLPKRDLTPPTKNATLELYGQIRSTLSGVGANEVLSYNFVHGNLLDKMGQSREQAFRLSNALSPDLQYFRLSVTPGLLEKVHPNIKADYSEFALFELGKSHNKVQRDDEDLPLEVSSLALVFAVSEKASAEYAGAPYYQARKYLMHVLSRYPNALYAVSYQPLAEADLFSNAWLMHAAAPFDPARSAVIIDADKRAWGVVGEYKASVHRSFKLPSFVAGFELDPQLLANAGASMRYVKQSKFPSIEQDICLKVPVSTSYAQVNEFVWARELEFAPEGSQLTLAPVDIYKRPDDPDHKQITLRVIISHTARTLTDQEVAKLLDQIAVAAKEKLGAERI
jgi:phenylalanyl-tRNA synthetase beta chain